MKDLSERFSKRTIKFIFALFALLVFSLSAWNAVNILYLNVTSNDQCAWRNIPGRPGAYLITDVVPGGVTDKAGIKDGDILLKLEGKDLITEGLNQNSMVIINAIKKGDYCTYLVERDGRTFEAKVEVLKITNIAYLSGFLFGLGFLIVGFVVVMSKPTGQVQRMFAYFSFLSMMLVGLNNFQLTSDMNIAFRILVMVCMYASRIFAPIMFVVFFMYFPVRKNFKWTRAFVIVSILINLGAAVYLSLPRPPQNDTPDLFVQVLGSLPLMFLIAGIVVFSHSYFKLVDAKRKRSLTPVLISSIVAVAAFIYTVYINYVNPFAVYVNPAALLPGLLLFLAPLGYGYSIFRYKLMDTEVLIKKSLMYAIITPMIAAVYVVFVFGTGDILGQFLGHNQNRTLSLIALIIIAFVFDPLKRRIQDWVDKIFYLERQNYQKVLLEFSRKLPLQVDLKQILNSVVTTISGTMHIERVGVVLFGEDKSPVFVSKNLSDKVTGLAESPQFMKYLSQQKEPLLSPNVCDDCLNEISAIDKEIIKTSQAELAIPIQLQDKLMGVIFAGPKLSEKIYSQDDLNLLATVANQTAIAVENSRLYEKERALSHVQEELRLAYKIQLEWLPKNPPVIQGFDIAGKTIPAEIVGGDYYDFIPVDDDRISLCIGDVSGKGLSASMLMANLHAMVRSQTLSNPVPSECVRQTNRLIFESSNDEMFITLFYGLLNINDRSFSFTNGGHNLPLYLPVNKHIKRLDTDGLVIGINRNSRYAMDKITFKPGDILVMYTDGISEAFNEAEEQYGEERIISCVNNFRSESSARIIDLLLEDVTVFSGSMPKHDDMTLVVVKAD